MARYWVPIFKTEDDYPDWCDLVVVHPSKIFEYTGYVQATVTRIMRSRMPVNAFDERMLTLRDIREWRRYWRFYYDTYYREVVWCGPYYPDTSYIKYEFEKENPEVWAGKRCFRIFKNYWSNGFCIFPRGSYSDQLKMVDGSEEFDRMALFLMFERNRSKVRPVVDLIAYYHPAILPTRKPIVEASFVYRKQWHRAYFDGRYIDLAYHILPRPFICVHAVRVGSDVEFFMYFPRYSKHDRMAWFRKSYGVIAPLKLSSESQALLRTLRGEDQGYRVIYDPMDKRESLVERTRRISEVRKEMRDEDYYEFILKGFDPDLT